MDSVIDQRVFLLNNPENWTTQLRIRFLRPQSAIVL